MLHTTNNVVSREVSLLCTCSGTKIWLVTQKKQPTHTKIYHYIKGNGEKYGSHRKRTQRTPEKSNLSKQLNDNKNHHFKMAVTWNDSVKNFTCKF